MNKSKLTALVGGSIAAVATVISYLLIFDNIFAMPIRWVSLLLVLITEALLTAKAFVVKADLINHASMVTGFAHFLAVIIVSVVFLSVFQSGVKAYVLLNVLMLCILAMVDLFVLHFGKNTSSSNKKIAHAKERMNACFDKVQSLIVIHGQSNYKADLIDISDLIKYSDNTESTEYESQIMSKLDELEAQLSDNEDGVPGLISEIKNAIKLREIKVKSLKRGGY